MPTTVSEIASRLQEMGDNTAWRLFDDRYRPILKLYFMKCGCNNAANDLVQETIRRVVEGMHKQSYKSGKGRLRHWIRGIAWRVLQNHLRKREPQTNVDASRGGFWDHYEDPTRAEAESATDDRFDAIWIRSRLSALIREATRGFDQRTLHCYFLVEVRRLQIREVALRVGLSETSVYQKRKLVAAWMLAVAPRFISEWER